MKLNLLKSSSLGKQKKETIKTISNKKRKLINQVFIEGKNYSNVNQTNLYSSFISTSNYLTQNFSNKTYGFSHFFRNFLNRFSIILVLSSTFKREETEGLKLFNNISSKEVKKILLEKEIFLEILSLIDNSNNPEPFLDKLNKLTDKNKIELFSLKKHLHLL